MSNHESFSVFSGGLTDSKLENLPEIFYWFAIKQQLNTLWANNVLWAKMPFLLQSKEFQPAKSAKQVPSSMAKMEHPEAAGLRLAARMLFILISTFFGEKGPF